VVLFPPAETCGLRILPPGKYPQQRNCSRSAVCNFSEFYSAASSRRTRRPHGRRPVPDRPLFQIMDEIERRIIVDMLDRTGWKPKPRLQSDSLIPLSTFEIKRSSAWELMCAAGARRRRIIHGIVFR